MAKGDMNSKLAEWLRGRNGNDELSTCVLILALLLVIINIFTRSFILSVVALALMAYAWWRMASRDLESRENENGVFCEFIGPVGPWLRNPVRAAKEVRAYKHLKCPECGQRVRVPRGKGKIRVRCPQCQQKFEART